MAELHTFEYGGMTFGTFGKIYLLKTSMLNNRVGLKKSCF